MNHIRRRKEQEQQASCDTPELKVHSLHCTRALESEFVNGLLRPMSSNTRGSCRGVFALFATCLVVAVMLLFETVTLSNQTTTRNRKQKPGRKYQTATFSRTADGLPRHSPSEGPSLTHDVMNKSRGGIWESSTILPQWMKDYFVWHQEQRAKLNETNWQSHRYLVLRCLEPEDRMLCGGASDRLQAIPFLLMVASQSNRILFIKWEQPAPLEQFLVPPEGGLDWRIPTWFDEKLNIRGSFIQFFQQLPRLKTGESVVPIRLNENGLEYYNSHVASNEASFQQVYQQCWSVVFEPSPPVAALLEQQMQSLGLQASNYTAVHIRSLFEENAADDLDMIHNAVKCGSQLGSQMFVATDSKNVTLKALAYGQEKGVQVVARISDKELVHLERGADFLDGRRIEREKLAAEAYYDTFVDLYLLASAQCVAYGIGRYGLWGSLLSSNSSCSIDHNKTLCEWRTNVQDPNATASNLEPPTITTIQEGSSTVSTPRFSVVVPAIMNDVATDLPRLFRSIDDQTFAPHEVIVVISGVDEAACAHANTTLQKPSRSFPIRMECVVVLQNQAKSRNRGIELSKGEWVSFFDADDVMHPKRLATIAEHIRRVPELRLVLHGFAQWLPGTTDKQDHAPIQVGELRRGEYIFDEAEQSRNAHDWILAGIMHSEPTVRRGDLDKVRFRSEPEYFRREDSLFVRDLILQIGRKDSEILFDPSALGYHIPRQLQTNTDSP